MPGGSTRPHTALRGQDRTETERSGSVPRRINLAKVCILFPALLSLADGVRYSEGQSSSRPHAGAGEIYEILTRLYAAYHLGTRVNEFQARIQSFGQSLIIEVGATDQCHGAREWERDHHGEKRVSTVLGSSLPRAVTKRTWLWKTRMDYPLLEAFGCG